MHRDECVSENIVTKTEFHPDSSDPALRILRHYWKLRQGIAHQPFGQIRLDRDLAHTVCLCDLGCDPDDAELLVDESPGVCLEAKLAGLAIGHRRPQACE